MISFVQSAQAVNTSSVSLSGVAAGDLLVLGYTNYNSSGYELPTSVTDTQGNTWIRVGPVVVSNTGNAVVAIYLTVAGSSGDDTITCNGISATYFNLAAGEYGLGSDHWAVAPLGGNSVNSGYSIEVSSQSATYVSEPVNQGGNFLAVSDDLPWVAVTWAYDDWTDHSWTSSSAIIRESVSNTAGGVTAVFGDDIFSNNTVLGTPYTNTYSNPSHVTAFQGTYGVGLAIFDLSSGGGGSSENYGFVA